MYGIDAESLRSDEVSPLGQGLPQRLIMANVWWEKWETLAQRLGLVLVVGKHQRDRLTGEKGAAVEDGLSSSRQQRLRVDVKGRHGHSELLDTDEVEHRRTALIERERELSLSRQRPNPLPAMADDTSPVSEDRYANAQGGLSAVDGR
jgi:hypothetical protein